MRDMKAANNAKRRYSMPRTELIKGVRRETQTDGRGRKSVWYRATIRVNGKSRQCRRSVDRYGESGARLLTTLQRMIWIVEMGAWNPNDGDPLALLGYTDIYEGNRDYQDSVISEVRGPWTYEYNRDEDAA